MPALSHFAINADDIDRAKRFYQKVFGWSFAAWGPPGFYQIEGAGVRGALQGRRALVPGVRTIGFECTIGVDSIDAVEKAVLSAGGKVALARSVIVGAMQYDTAAQ